MFIWAGNCCMLLKKYDLALKFFMYVYQKPNLQRNTKVTCLEQIVIFYFNQ